MAVTPRDAKPPAPVKRRGLYNGWLIALIASLASGLTIGTSNYAFGVFIEPLEEQYGWTRTQINTALVFGVASALISPLVGRWIDRFGSRPVMVGSLVVVAAGFVIYAGMTSLWHFYVASALIYLGLPGATMIPSGRLISIWFAGTRGRMMGFVTAGNNIGGLTMVPLAALVVGTSGWRWGYVAFAVIILLIGLVTLIYVRDRQSDVDAARDKRWAPRESEKESLGDSVGYSLGDVMRMRSFYFLAIGHAVPPFTYAVVVTQLIPHLESQGISSGAAATGVMLLSMFGIASKLIFGRLSETITARWAMAISLAFQSAALFLLIIVGGSAAVWFVIAFYGMGMGAMGALLPLTVVEAYGMRHFGTILGVTSMPSIIPIIVGPLMAGMIFDTYGTYDIAFGIMGLMFALGALAMAMARRPVTPGSTA